MAEKKKRVKKKEKIFSKRVWTIGPLGIQIFADNKAELAKKIHEQNCSLRGILDG